MSTSLLAALAVVTSAGAQVVRGSVVDRGGVPVPGVVVRLIGADSATVASALTNERGAFSVRSLRPGAFTLQTLRVGFRPVVSDPFTLAAGETIERRVELTGVAVALGQVRIAARSACGRAVALERATFELLEQVRAAITATDLMAASGEIRTSGVSYRRRNDAAGLRVLGQQAEFLQGFGGQPWVPVEVDLLRREGYVIDVGDSLSYRAPGLATLASDEFIIDHCFRVSQGSEGSRIAIEFTPNRDRSVPEIRGTIWLDQKTLELQRIEYRYVGIRTALQDAGAGGDVNFVRTTSGAWVVSSWGIKMPELALRRGSIRGRPASAASDQIIVEAITRTGGDLSFVLRAGSTTDTLWARAPITVTGTIIDSLSEVAVAGAQVTVREVKKSTITPPSGAFRIEGLFPGEYTVEVQTTSLDSVNTRVVMPLTVIDTGVQMRLHVPSALLVATSICKMELTNRSLPGIVMGSVRRLDADSSAVPSATVIAEWLEGSNGEIRSRDVKADGSGNFRFCGVPVGKTVAVRAGTESGSSEPFVATVPANRRLARAELYIDPALPPNATFVGTVLGDSANPKPLEGVEIAIPSLSMSARTNARGEFRLRDVPPGEHAIVARRLGYGPLDTKLTFTANGTVQRRIVLSSVAVLNEVNIRAERARVDPLMGKFEENRKLGLGKFLTRDDMEKLSGMSLVGALSTIPGIRHAPYEAQNAAWVMSTRGQLSINPKCIKREDSPILDCNCYPAVYLDRIPLYRGGDRGEAPNLKRYSPDQIEAVEFYKSAAQTPMEYSNLDSNCGVLVLHTRRDFGDKPAPKKPPRSN